MWLGIDIDHLFWIWLAFPFLCAENFIFYKLLARLRRPGGSGTKTFPWTYPSYMQSFIKIRCGFGEK